MPGRKNKRLEPLVGYLLSPKEPPLFLNFNNINLRKVELLKRGAIKFKL